jgi:hypothetical protein
MAAQNAARLTVGRRWSDQSPRELFERGQETFKSLSGAASRGPFALREAVARHGALDLLALVFYSQASGEIVGRTADEQAAWWQGNAGRGDAAYVKGAQAEGRQS